MKTSRNEEGMITAFATVFAVALLLFVGLVYDGGTMVADKEAAIDHAEGAARAGAQSLGETDYRTSGQIALDPTSAHQSAVSYLQQANEEGDVQVNGDEVRVTVHRTVPLKFLGVGGLVHAQVSGVGQAHLEEGQN